MNTHLHFCYVSHAIVSGTYPYVTHLSLPRLDQKFLPRLADYNDVIRGPLFQPCLGPPNAMSTTGTTLICTM